MKHILIDNKEGVSFELENGNSLLTIYKFIITDPTESVDEIIENIAQNDYYLTVEYEKYQLQGKMVQKSPLAYLIKGDIEYKQAVFELDEPLIIPLSHKNNIKSDPNPTICTIKLTHDSPYEISCVYTTSGKVGLLQKV